MDKYKIAHDFINQFSGKYAAFILDVRGYPSRHISGLAIAKNAEYCIAESVQELPKQHHYYSGRDDDALADMLLKIMQMDTYKGIQVRVRMLSAGPMFGQNPDDLIKVHKLISIFDMRSGWEMVCEDAFDAAAKILDMDRHIDHLVDAMVWRSSKRYRLC